MTSSPFSSWSTRSARMVIRRPPRVTRRPSSCSSIVNGCRCFSRSSHCPTTPSIRFCSMATNGGLRRARRIREKSRISAPAWERTSSSSSFSLIVTNARWDRNCSQTRLRMPWTSWPRSRALKPGSGWSGALAARRTSANALKGQAACSLNKEVPALNGTSPHGGARWSWMVSMREER